MGYPKPTGREEQERLDQIDMILKELQRHMDELMALCSDAADLAPGTNVNKVTNVPLVASANRTASRAPSSAIRLARRP